MSEELPEPDATLRAALKKAVLTERASPQLRTRVDALFDAPPAMPLTSSRRLWIALAASVLIGACVSILVISMSGHDEEDEYLVSEDKLWPAMASLHTAPASAKASLDDIARSIGAPVASLPESEGQLVSAEASWFAGVPAAVLKYRVGEDEITLVSADAGKILRETDETEKYHKFSGAVQLAGGNRGALWLCALSSRSVPEAKLTGILDRATIVTPPPAR